MFALLFVSLTFSLLGIQGWRRRRRGSGLVVRAETFGQLTTGLESAWNKLRGVGE